MKLLIEIPDKHSSNIKKKFNSKDTIDGIFDYLKKVEKASVEIIPDNAKNIDVLMTVFPKADIRFEGRNNELFGYIEFAGDWLDAPYKADKGVEE